MREKKFASRLVIVCLALVAFAVANDQRGHGSIPAGSVPSFAGNPQHTALYAPTVPNLNRIRWSATIDFNNVAYAHYGAPLVTAANTVLAPVKIPVAQPSPSPPIDGFRVDAFDGVTGATKYSLASDYVLPPHNWIPVYNPCLTTGAFGTR